MDQAGPKYGNRAPMLVASMERLLGLTGEWTQPTHESGLTEGFLPIIVR